ncbi:class I SAM-dependent methyltransferase [Bdellovibrionota bacterium FG-1]
MIEVCPNCQTPNSKRLFMNHDALSGENFDICRCFQCGLVRTDLKKPLSELGHYYPAEYYNANSGRLNPVENVLRWFRDARARRIMTLHPRPGRVLDIGCSRGIMLNKLRDEGWDPQGVERSETSSRYAREVLGLPVKVAQDLKSCEFPDSHFDVITLWHVLEHLADFKATLAEVRRILKPGGTLLVEVPNLGSLQAQLTQGEWIHIDAPRHLIHFDYETLIDALKGQGFKPYEIGTLSWEMGPFGFLQSLFNRMTPKNTNFLYWLLKNRGSGRGCPVGALFWKLLGLHLILLFPLGVFSLLLEIHAALQARGSVLRVVSQD